MRTWMLRVRKMQSLPKRLARISILDHGQKTRTELFISVFFFFFFFSKNQKCKTTLRNFLQENTWFCYYVFRCSICRNGIHIIEQERTISLINDIVHDDSDTKNNKQKNQLYIFQFLYHNKFRRVITRQQRALKKTFYMTMQHRLLNFQ